MVKQYSSVIKELEVLDNGLLVLVIVIASVFCSSTDTHQQNQTLFG